MSDITRPVPANEMQRVIELTELDLDYTAIQESFRDLADLAAKVAGSEISMVNLIDVFTQWTISNHGIDVKQIPREKSICQYTIVQKEEMEVQDLSEDSRFKDSALVTQRGLRYYFGVPLRTEEGNNLGALCVMDRTLKKITPEKVEMLRLIAHEIINKLNAMKRMRDLNAKVREAMEAKRKMAHDIRGPLGGMVGLAQVITSQGDENTMDEVLELMNIMQKSGNSLLELAEDILGTDKKIKPAEANPLSPEFTLLTLKDKLEELYTPQAVNKKLSFSVKIVSETEHIAFPRNKLLQIAGNLISNAIKFTASGGRVNVGLSLQPDKLQNMLTISVSDTGTGMTEKQIQEIMEGEAHSTAGTGGEQGYGFGLVLVKHLIDGLNGRLQISSKIDEGTVFQVEIPVKRFL